MILFSLPDYFLINNFNDNRFVSFRFVSFRFKPFLNLCIECLVQVPMNNDWNNDWNWNWRREEKFHKKTLGGCNLRRQLIMQINFIRFE